MYEAFFDPRYEQSIAEPIDPVTGRAWISASERTAEMINVGHGVSAAIAFGFRHALFNLNTVNLQELLRKGVSFASQQIEPTMTAESVDGYLAWIESADACVLLTSDEVLGDFLPAVKPAFMQEAARKAGFVPDQQLLLPDGQTITLWRHQSVPSNCLSH